MTPQNKQSAILNSDNFPALYLSLLAENLFPVKGDGDFIYFYLNLSFANAFRETLWGSSYISRFIDFVYLRLNNYIREDKNRKSG